MHSAMDCLLSYAGGSLWLAALLAAGGAASFFARRVGMSITHRVWVVALAFATIVPTLPALPALRGQLPWPMVRADFRGHAAVSMRATRVLSGGGWGEHFLLSSKASHILCAMYAGAVLWALLRLLRSMVATTWLLRRATPYVLQPELEEVWAEAKEAFGVSPRLLLRKMCVVPSP